MIVSRLRSVAVLICLGLGILALVSSPSVAQVLPGDNPSVASNITSSLTGGALVPFRFQSGCDDGGLVSGIFSASYDYNSFNFRQGIKFGAFRLGYSVPLQISGGAVVMPFVRLYHAGIRKSTQDDITQSAQTFGLLQDEVCLGGKYTVPLSQGLWVKATAEYDASRREGSWYSGGSAGVSVFSLVHRFGLVNLSAKYYSESASAGDMSVSLFPNGVHGYQVGVGYTYSLSFYSSQPTISGEWYSFNTGSSGEAQRGWCLRVSAPLYAGLFQLRGSAGYDNVILGNYSIGAEVNIPL